jgi:hypothetical protein
MHGCPHIQAMSRNHLWSKTVAVLYKGSGIYRLDGDQVAQGSTLTLGARYGKTGPPTSGVRPYCLGIIPVLQLLTGLCSGLSVSITISEGYVRVWVAKRRVDFAVGAIWLVCSIPYGLDVATKIYAMTRKSITTRTLASWNGTIL